MEMAVALAIQWTEKALRYVGDRHITYLMLDVELIEEPCTQIWNPKITPGSDQGAVPPQYKEWPVDSAGSTPPRSVTLRVYASEAFESEFGHPARLHISLEGLLKKSLVLGNIEPKITNICKIPQKE